MDIDADGAVPNRGPAVFVVTTATLVLASVFVGARLICRYFIVRNVSWDDRVIFLAWVLSFFLSFTIDYGVTHGLGKHDANISAHDWPILRRCEYVFSILYNPALMATKTSILIFYLRLARNTQVVLRYASWATLAVVNIAGVVLTFMNVFQCNPIAAAWSSTFHEKTNCIPLLTEFICSSPVNIVTDLAILALPIPVLTGMRIPSRQKTILVFTFTLGIFVTIVDVVRIFYLQQAISEVPTGSSADPSSRFGGQTDFAWNASFSLMWSAVEVNVGMTCACIPTLKPLMLKLLPAILYDPDGTRTMTSSKGPSDSDGPARNQTGLSHASPTLRPLGNGDDLDEITPPVTAMEFLTTPEMGTTGDGNFGTTSATRSRTGATVDTAATSEQGVYFGFVNMAKPKSMLKTNNRESFKYCLIVSILFFLWGLSYGLLNTLNNAVGAVNHNTAAQDIGLTSAYFGGGYFFGPLLVGEWILRRDEHNRSKRHTRDEADNVGGFKVTFIVGLCIYGIGTIIFWPSAVTNSYGGFMLSNFVVGFGLSVLEVGANSFMILCGPPAYGELRLCAAQGLQAIGSVVSGLLAQKAFFKNVGKSDSTDSTTLINVQWTYLGITLLSVILGLFFFYMPLPEVSDEELEESANRLPVNPQRRSFGGLQLRTVSLVLAVLAQYMYVGAQESNSIFFKKLMISVLPGQNKNGDGALIDGASSGNPDKPPGLSLAASDYLLIGHTAFAVSRFLAAWLTYLSVSRPRLPQPRTILGLCVVMSFVCALHAVVLRPKNGNLLFIPVVLFFFAEGPIWPLVFSIGLRGQGRRTKRAAAFITMGCSGAAFFPFVMYGIISKGGSVQTAFIVVLALQVPMGAFPLFACTVKDAKKLLDPNSHLRYTRTGDETTDKANAERRLEKTAKGSSSLLARVSKEIGAKLTGSKWKGSQTPNVEHSEGTTNQQPP